MIRARNEMYILVKQHTACLLSTDTIYTITDTNWHNGSIHIIIPKSARQFRKQEVMPKSPGIQFRHIHPLSSILLHQLTTHAGHSELTFRIIFCSIHPRPPFTPPSSDGRYRSLNISANERIRTRPPPHQIMRRSRSGFSRCIIPRRKVRWCSRM
jgi:hypothetical protein